MSKFYSDEQWKPISIDRKSKRVKYAVSNYGRILSYTEDIESGNLIKGSSLGGYPTLRVRNEDKNMCFYVHKLVAEYFLTEHTQDEDNVIHIDYNKKNNHIDNLKWVNKEDWLEHYRANPNVIAAKEKLKDRKPLVGKKLTSTDVMRIKKKIFDPNRKTRLKIIAKQFGISEMQLYRIKSGENWSHIRVEGEPVRN